jgi:hypothetical protein
MEQYLDLEFARTRDSRTEDETFESATAEAIDAGQLERTYTGLNVYRTRAKGVFDKIANLVGLSAEATKAALVQETRRYTVIDDPADATREQVWGVAVRLAVATTSVDVNVAVTIPVVAATVELNYADARAAIDVLGYSGDFGEKLPAPTQLDVNSYAAYMTSFAVIQAQVFSDRDNQRPTLLATRTKGQADESER